MDNIAKRKPWIVIALTIAAAVASAQTSSSPSATDKNKIADALRAGPSFVTKEATIVDWPTTPNGDYRVLREGRNGWTCLPGRPNRAHDEPGCFDDVFLQFIKDSYSGRTPRVERVGISYMYVGAWVPHQANVDEPPDHHFHVGPHIMIVTPKQEDVRAFSRNAASGNPYINHLPGRNEMFLVIPIRSWNDQPR